MLNDCRVQEEKTERGWTRTSQNEGAVAAVVAAPQGPAVRTGTHANWAASIRPSPSIPGVVGYGPSSDRGSWGILEAMLRGIPINYPGIAWKAALRQPHPLDQFNPAIETNGFPLRPVRHILGQHSFPQTGVCWGKKVTSKRHEERDGMMMIKTIDLRSV